MLRSFPGLSDSRLCAILLPLDYLFSGPILRSCVKPTHHSVLIRIFAVVTVVGIHLAVLGAILSSPPLRSAVELPEAGEVRFVEIAAELIDAAPAIDPVDDAAEGEPQPEIIPEPVIQEPGPERVEPAPVVEPPVQEAIPEEIKPDLEPEPIAEPEPEPKVEPKSEPPPIVEPKIEPKSPVKPKVVPKPVHKPKPKLKARVQPTPSSAARQASDSAAPDGKSQLAAAPSAIVPPADADRPRLIGKVDYLGSRPSPDYPRASIRRGETGRVVVRVLISAQGVVANATLRKSSGHERLDESALRAARLARFKPYTENGMPYPALADIPFDFVL